jgi:hypothetical protein
MFDNWKKTFLLYINRSDSYFIQQFRKFLPDYLVNQISDYEFAELKTELLTTIALNEKEISDNKDWIGIENTYEGGGDRLGGESDALS